MSFPTILSDGFWFGVVATLALVAAIRSLRKGP